MAGHSLRGKIPRAFGNHKTPEGRIYGAYVRALQERLGPLPASAAPLLRQAGRLLVEIQGIESDYDKARARSRQTDMRRLRRHLTGARALLLKTEERLETIAAREPRDLTAALKGLHR